MPEQEKPCLIFRKSGEMEEESVTRILCKCHKWNDKFIIYISHLQEYV